MTLRELRLKLEALVAEEPILDEFVVCVDTNNPDRDAGTRDHEHPSEVFEITTDGSYGRLLMMF